MKYSFKIRNIFVLLLIAIFMFVPFFDVNAASPYDISVELYEFDGLDTADFLMSYQDGDAVKISDGAAINPGSYVAAGVKYKVGDPADAMIIQIGMYYDPNALELVKDEDLIMLEFDNRAEKNGGVFPGTGSAATRVRWTISDANEMPLFKDGKNLINVTLGDESASRSLLTNPGGVMFFYFFKVKDDATPQSKIEFTFDDERNSKTDQDGNASSMTSTPVSYEVYGEVSSDNTLASLTVKNGETSYILNPTFVAGSTTTNYNTVVPNAISSIDLQAVGHDSGASILPGELGNKNLVVGDNSFSITVTAADGSAEIYTIVIKRLSNVASLSALSLSGITLTPNFSDSSYKYTATVPYRTTSTLVSATAVSPGTIREGTGNFNFATAGLHKKSVIVDAEDCNVLYKDVPGNVCSSNTYELEITRSNPSTDTTLSDLKVNNVTVNGFTSGTDTYTLAPVVNSVTSLNVTATPSFQYATYVVNGNNNLKVGDNAITVVVTAEDGVSKGTYTLNVYRQSNDTTLSALNVTSDPQGVLSPNFSSGTRTYTYTYDEKVTKIDINGTTTNANVKSVTGFKEYTIGVDTNAVITVTAEDGTTNSYTINFERKKSSDTSLGSLSVENSGTVYTLNPSFSPTEDSYTVSVPNNIDSVEIKATAGSANAKGVTGTGNKTLDFGNNDFELVVTAEDNKTKTYNIRVVRELNTDATLTGIDVNGTAIAGFTSGTDTYTLDPVSGSITSLNITAHTSYPHATYTVTGNSNLKFGNNSILVEVTAQDGTTKETYTLNVYRQSNDTTLSELNVTSDPQGVLSPNFSSGTRTYTYTYDEKVTKIDINGTTTNANVKSVTGFKEYTIGVDTNAVITVTAEDGTTNSYTINFERKKSSDTSLGSLSVENSGTVYTLNPSFSPTEDSYTVSVPNNIDSVEIKATAGSANAKGVTGTGNKTLDFGNNDFELVVTAEDNKTKTYNIRVVRELNTDATLTGIDVNGTAIAGFTSGTDTYTLDPVSGSITSLNITAHTSYPHATYTVTGNSNLKFGNNSILVEVTAQDGTTKETYTLNVYRKSNNTTLSELIVTSDPQGVLTPTFSGNKKSYRYIYDESVEKINVNATAADSKVIRIEGIGEYTVGVDTVATIKVVAEDESEDTYTVTFERETSSDVTLASLSVENGDNVYTLDPRFSPNVDTYTVSVPNDIDQVEIKATASSENVKSVTGIGNKSLAFGNNEVKIVVTAEDDSTKTYTVNIKRELSSDADLLDIKVGGVSVTDFNKDTITYTLDPVGSAISSLAITYTKSHDEADVVVSGADFLVEGLENNITLTVTSQDGSVTKVYTLKVRRLLSDANLATLEVTSDPQGVLTPEFNPNTNSYVYKYDRTVTTIHVAATSNDAIGITGTGDYTIGTDSQATITITPEDGNLKTYVIDFEQVLDDDGTLSALTVSKDGSDYTLSPVFAPDHKEYEVHVTSDVTSVNISAVANSPYASSVIEGVGDVTLEYGSNEFEIKVTAENNEKTIYKLTIIRAMNSNSGLASLEVDGVLVPGFVTSKTSYTLDAVSNIKDSIVISATGEENTTVTGTGTKTLQVGDNRFEVVVTAQDNVTKTTYVINIRRKSDNNYLGNLEISEGTLTPTFNKETENYTATVASGITSVIVTASKEDQASKLEIGKDLTSLTETDTYTYSDLKAGANELKIKVTSENGTEKVYTLVITREQDPTDQKITSSVYNVTTDNILGVKSLTSIDDFKDNIDNENAYLVIYDSTDTTVVTDSNIGTGMIVKLIINGEIKDQKVIIVLGDTTGDGEIDLLDAVKITNDFIGKSSLTGAYRIAGNVIDDDAIDLLDAVKVTNHFIGKALID